MMEIWMKMFEVDIISGTLIVLICAVGSAIMKAMLPSPGLAFLAAPVTVFFAFATTAVAREYGYTLGAEKVLDVAVAAGAGMTLGAIVTMVVFRTIVALSTR